MPRPSRTSPKTSPANSKASTPNMQSKASTPNTQSKPDLSAAAAARKRMRSDDHCPDNETEANQNDRIGEIKTMLQTWKAEQEIVLKKLISDVAALKVQNDNIKQTNLEIEKSMSHINKNYEDIRSKILEYEKERKGFVSCILGLEQKVKDIQHSSRTSSIEIKNIPMPEKESATDLISLVTKIGTSMQLNIKTSDIRDIYRLPGKAGTTRSVFAEFNTVHLKNELLFSTRSFNKNRALDEKLNTETIGLPGKRQPVYIAEYMGPSTRKLFYHAREFAKANNYTFCWCSNGNVFLRKDMGMKQIRIESELTLNKLKPQL